MPFVKAPSPGPGDQTLGRAHARPVLCCSAPAAALTSLSSGPARVEVTFFKDWHSALQRVCVTLGRAPGKKESLSVALNLQQVSLRDPFVLRTPEAASPPTHSLSLSRGTRFLPGAEHEHTRTH